MLAGTTMHDQRERLHPSDQYTIFCGSSTVQVMTHADGPRLRLNGIYAEGTSSIMFLLYV